MWLLNHAEEVQQTPRQNASELRPRLSVEATSYDILAVNQNANMKSETFPLLLLVHMFINWLS